jgi:hypothetical protein
MSTVSRNLVRPDNISKLPAISICFYPKILVTLSVKSLYFTLFFSLRIAPFIRALQPFSRRFHLNDGQGGTAQFFSVNNSVFPYAHYLYLIHLPPNLYSDLQGKHFSPFWLKNEIFELLNSYLSLPLRGES